MTETVRHDLELAGCTPEPLMAYLKALGILRLVSEQKDAEARGWWKNDTFWLRSPVLFRDTTTAEGQEAAKAALIEFFLREYKPTPIVVPWSGGDFFAVKWQPKPMKVSKTPTASKAVEAILATQTPRFEPYRNALLACKAALDQCRITSKKEMGKNKWVFIQTLRSICDETGLIEWIDAAAVITVEKFAALLGSGGGSDGNTHFSDNFMQNLWDVLPDFDEARDPQKGQPGSSVADGSREQLADALFAIGTNRLVLNRTSSLYDSGAVGGPNATQGMERDSLSNPWNVILTLEGTVCFAGAAVKRLTTNSTSESAFPFQVSASVTSCDRLADKERAGKELWLPLWSRPARSDEVLAFLREGRAQCGPRPAKSGVDMARAVATLGIDRGIASFHRYAIVKGRVGGDNYNTAASLGCFEVRERANADLLREIDQWLDRFRSACSAKDAPARLGRVLRAIDSAIFDFCKYGGKPFFQKIVIALGAAQRELSLAERFREARKLRPLAGLSCDWIGAANDGSAEFAVALALVSLRDPEDKIGPLCVNLESVDWKKNCRAWAEKDRAVVWNAADLSTNLVNVLQRRMMDGRRAGCECLPLASHIAAPLDIIAAFIAGELDDQRIEDLIWGLMLVKPTDASGKATNAAAPPAVLPRAYALLKLVFLPGPLAVVRSGNRLRWRLAHSGEAGINIRLEPRILPLLRAGRVGEACAIAARRLRASGLPPMPGPVGGAVRDLEWSECDADRRRAQRLAAALLIPISSGSVNDLVHLVCRDVSAVAEALTLSMEGESE